MPVLRSPHSSHYSHSCVIVIVSYVVAKPDRLESDKDPVEEDDKVDVEKGHGEGGANKSPSKLQ